jgi:TfoX/Sxy family transcriptional regulator of competence genes
MAYSEELAERIRNAIGAHGGISERRMFGGIVWLVDGNMACGTRGEDMMVRMDRADVERALAEVGVHPMEMRGRRMRGFVTVDAATIDDDADLARWAHEGLSFAASLPPK